VNDTEENDAFQIDHVRRTQETSETTDDAQQRKADSLARNDMQKELKRFQNNVDKSLQTKKPTMLTRPEQRI
jgi:hypothetical protein